jgi:uncharacterized membrane protein
VRDDRGMNQLMRYFFRGLLVLVPASATIAILWFLITKVDRWIGAPMEKLIGIPVPGAGILVLLVSTVVIGVLASTFVTRTVFELIEKLFVRVPLVKLIYSSIRDLTGAFVGEKKGFDNPVLVSFGEGQGGLLGFVTRESLDAIGMPEHVAVYFPQSYNFAGLVLVVPREKVRRLPVPSADVLAFAVSGGVSGLLARK